MTVPGTARSVLDHAAPAVRVQVGNGTGAVGQLLREAVELLADHGRVRAAARGARADLLHTVGDVEVTDEPAARRVHTLDRVVLRPGGEFAPSWQWLHRQRRRALGCAAVLTHGRMAGRLVVESALAPGERVYCLPVLGAAPDGPVPGPGRGPTAARIDARRRLGVPPGVRVVVGSSSERSPGVGDWAAALRRLARRDLLVVEVQEEAGSRSGNGGSSASSWSVPLAAADLYVASARELTAVSGAVAALDLGVPVIAVTTDSAAELVTPGRDGRVVAPRVDAIVGAVVSALDGTTLAGRAESTPRSVLTTRELARTLLTIYEEALASPARRRRSSS